jgi:hypothetical protein
MQSAAAEATGFADHRLAMNIGRADPSAKPRISTRDAKARQTNGQEPRDEIRLSPLDASQVVKCCRVFQYQLDEAYEGAVVGVLVIVSVGGLSIASDDVSERRYGPHFGRRSAASEGKFTVHGRVSFLMT